MPIRLSRQTTRGFQACATLGSEVLQMPIAQTLGFGFQLEARKLSPSLVLQDDFSRVHFIFLT